MEASCAVMYRISESWLRDTNDKELYVFKDYAVYSNCHPYKSGGVMLLIKPTLRSALRSALHPLTRQVSLLDEYNLCAIKLHNYLPQAALVFVYRLPNATDGDTVAMFHELSGFLSASGSEVIVAGDFNSQR